MKRAKKTETARRVPPIEVERQGLHYLPVDELIRLLEKHKREQAEYVDNELARLRRAQEMAN